MKKLIILVAAAFFVACFAGPALADKPGPEPGSKLVYNLNVIGFANCVMDPESADGVYPECFKGQGWDSNGHRIFVPLKTKHLRNICDEGGLANYTYDATILQKGVRIMVTDAEPMGVIDGDATDGKAYFQLPHGYYEVWARALGKPSTDEQARCMEINTLICEDLIDDVWTRVDCESDLSNGRWVLTGYLDVRRNKGTKPHWQNATSALLEGTGVLGAEPYMDFMWQIYNEYLKLLQIRFYEVEPPTNG